MRNVLLRLTLLWRSLIGALSSLARIRKSGPTESVGEQFPKPELLERDLAKSGARRKIRANQSGSFKVLGSPDRVYAFLANPLSFINLIPDLIEHEILRDGEFRIVWSVGAGMLKTTAALNMRLAESRPGEFVSYAGTGDIKERPLNLVANFRLVGCDSGTEIPWEGEMEVEGMAPAFKNLMEPIALLNIRKLVSRVQSALEADSY